MTTDTRIVDLGLIQQEIVAELQPLMGKEAELQRMLKQTRTRITALRGQLDLLARLQQPQEAAPQPEPVPHGKPEE